MCSLQMDPLPNQQGSSQTTTHNDKEEGPLSTEGEPVDVQQEDELVVAVGAVVHTSGGR